MELNDLKSQLDHDVLQTRQLEETIGDQRRMEVRLKERPELDTGHVCLCQSHVVQVLEGRKPPNVHKHRPSTQWVPALSCGEIFLHAVSAQPDQTSRQLAMLLAQEQLEEAVEELEDMRIKHDALKADNATLLAECKSRPAGSPGNKAAADANGDAGGHSVPGAAEAAAAQAAAAHPLVTVQLEVRFLPAMPLDSVALLLQACEHQIISSLIARYVYCEHCAVKQSGYKLICARRRSLHKQDTTELLPR